MWENLDLDRMMMFGGIGADEKRGRGESDTNYRGPAVQKRARWPKGLHTFLRFSVVALIVDCAN